MWDLSWDSNQSKMRSPSSANSTSPFEPFIWSFQKLPSRTSSSSGLLIYRAVFSGSRSQRNPREIKKTLNAWSLGRSCLLEGNTFSFGEGPPPPPLPKSKNVLSYSQSAWAFLSCSSLPLPSLYFSFLGKNKARVSCGAVSGTGGNCGSRMCYLLVRSRRQRPFNKDSWDLPTQLAPFLLSVLFETNLD